MASGWVVTTQEPLGHLQAEHEELRDLHDLMGHLQAKHEELRDLHY